ncbi:MAG: hypothetical protein KGJ06_08460 [Pseudomonadota bacterium]|nr:hypothetical protein [Pseudomonadota bacterium]
MVTMQGLQPPKTASLVIVAAMAALLMLMIRHIAVTSDAYVTFRVVDNVTHGYGLRWNTNERVQVYTHPLWLFLHIPFYALWENIFYITVGLSLLCSMAAVAIPLLTFRRTWPQALGLFLAPLIASSSFVNNSVTGLENPLAHLLFAAFGYVLLTVCGARFWFWISFFCALALLNRLDTVIFYAPVMVYLLVARRPLHIGQCLLGALPIVGWELFSLFYYGFPFPNTKYAKMESIMSADSICQGVHYLFNLLALDLTGAEFLFAGVAIVPLYRRFADNGKAVIAPEMLAVALGILLYSLYVIDTGGTYLSGRFWSLPVFASIWLIYGVAAPHIRKSVSLWLAGVCLLARLIYPHAGTLLEACPSCFTGGIWPRYYSVTAAGFHVGSMPLPLPTVDRHHAPEVAITTGIGIFGYSGGPNVHMVNAYAFTDPLLARLPDKGVRMTDSVIEHWTRDIPSGYVEALKTGSTAQMNPALAKYYRKLRLIISGNLWDSERLREILLFNLGDYDYLIDEYIKSLPSPAEKPS